MCVRISTCFTTTGKFVTLQLRTFFVSSFLLATFTSVSIYSGQSGTVQLYFRALVSIIILYRSIMILIIRGWYNRPIRGCNI